MYGVDRDVKRNEGEASPYSTFWILMAKNRVTNTFNGYIEQGKSLSGGGSDMNMTSSDVAKAVSVPKPGKERLTTTEK